MVNVGKYTSPMDPMRYVLRNFLGQQTSNTHAHKTSSGVEFAFLGSPDSLPAELTLEKKSKLLVSIPIPKFLHMPSLPTKNIKTISLLLTMHFSSDTHPYKMSLVSAQTQNHPPVVHLLVI